MTSIETKMTEESAKIAKLLLETNERFADIPWKIGGPTMTTLDVDFMLHELLSRIHSDQGYTKLYGLEKSYMDALAKLKPFPLFNGTLLYNGKKLLLTSAESKIVLLLASAPRVFTYEEIFIAVHGRVYLTGKNAYALRRTIHTLVVKIRREFREFCHDNSVIATVNGIGLRWIGKTIQAELHKNA